MVVKGNQEERQEELKMGAAGRRAGCRATDGFILAVARTGVGMALARGGA